MKPIRHFGLLTDFGLKDSYVAEMKGIIYSSIPDAIVIDLSHEIAPQCIIEGALFIERFWEYWHIPMVFIAIVDPGVGSERRILIARDNHKFLICPDNGLGSFVFHKKHVEVRCLRKLEAEWERASKTFHGRDIMVPLALQIANGYELEELGPSVEDWIRLTLPKPVKSTKGILGEVLYFDRFGNAITNINKADLESNQIEYVRFKHRWSKIPFAETYSRVPKGKPLCLWGSSNRLEIAINCGSCKEEYRINPGAVIEIKLR